MCIVRVILRQLLALPCKLLLVYAIFSLCRGTIGEKCTTEWVQSTYTTSAWTFLVCWDVSVHFCSGFFLSHIFFLRRFFFWEKGFFSMGTLAMYPK